MSKEAPLEAEDSNRKSRASSSPDTEHNDWWWFGPSARVNSPAHPVFVGLCLGVVRLHQQGVPSSMTLTPQVPPEKQQFHTNPSAFICKSSKTWRKMEELLPRVAWRAGVLSTDSWRLHKPEGLRDQSGAGEPQPVPYLTFTSPCTLAANTNRRKIKIVRT